MPTLLEDRSLVFHWLKTARRAQIALLVGVLLGVFVFPYVRDAALNATLPSVSRHGGFLGLWRYRTRHPAFAPLSALATTLYWLVTTSGVGWLLWMHIPTALGVSIRRSPASEDDALAGGPGAALTMVAGPNPLATAGWPPLVSDARDSGGTVQGTPVARALGGRYVVESELGRGGMGIVYRAQDAVLGRAVALKELPTELVRNHELVARFRREARVLARLAHPHIVQIFDLVENAHGMWMAMELVEGGSLADALRDGRPMNTRELIRLGTQMTSALAYAHAQGVIHRDFKPHNVLLTSDRCTKVTDFGLAKLIQQAPALTQAGSLLGSPSYMSPEQVSGTPADQRADVYALGITLYEMATGRVPFEGDTGSVLAQHLTKPPPAPRSLVDNIPEPLEALLLDMLEKNQADRVADMATVAERLHEIAAF